MTPMQWFRMYAEFATDPEVQLLAFEDQRHFVMALCMKALGVLDKAHPNPEKRERILAAYLGLDPVAAGEAKRRLLEAGLIDADWQPVNWEKRQFRSDHNAADRKRLQRARGGHSDVTTTRRDGHNDVTTTGRDSHGLEQSRVEQSRAEHTDARARDPDSVAPSEPGSGAPGASPPAAEAAWTAIRATYPAGTYRGNEWARAEHHFLQLLEAGVPRETFLQAVRDYRAQQDAKGSTGTQYVLSPARFFTADHWRGPFPLPEATSPAADDPEAEQAWQEAIADSKPRTPRMQRAMEAIGGHSRIRLRTPFDEPKIRAEFLRAWRAAA